MLCALLLIPVELRSEETSEPDRLYRLLEQDAVVNPALALKLESDFGIALPAVEEYEELRRCTQLRFRDVSLDARIRKFSHALSLPGCLPQGRDGQGPSGQPRTHFGTPLR